MYICQMEHVNRYNSIKCNQLAKHWRKWDIVCEHLGIVVGSKEGVSAPGGGMIPPQ